MRILHLTDYHFSSNSLLQEKVVKKILSTLGGKGNSSIDLVLFTGDLVFAGDDKALFNKAKESLFDQLVNNLSVRRENIIFCPGNHDINRTECRTYSEYFEKHIRTDNDLDELYRNNNERIYKDLFLPSNNYADFLKQYHNSDSNNLICDLYSIHYRKIEDTNFAFVCVNSAWLSNIDLSGGKNDKGNLMLPNAIFNEISKEIKKKQVDKKVLLMHHPLDFLKEFNRISIENIIYQDFDWLFCGHIHQQHSSTTRKATNSIFINTAKASLAHKEALGGTLITFDTKDELRLSLQEITYVVSEDYCIINDSYIHYIPCTEEKEKLNKIRKKVQDKYSPELEEANTLILSEDNSKCNFINHFSTPVLKSTPSDEANQSISSLTNWECLLDEKNYFIFGKDKCGKTTLLKRIQLEYIKQYTENGLIPFYVDARQIEEQITDSFKLENILKTYYGLSNANSLEILNNDRLVLLVDNFRFDSAFAEYLKDFLNSHIETKIIICSDYSRSSDLILQQKEWSKLPFTTLYFNDLRRSEIIEYTDKNLLSEENKETVQEQIINLCKQMELPFNYWTISLLLLIHHKSSNTYSKNLFSILDVCVDQIFDKRNLILKRCRLSFGQLKLICANLAKFLFKEHKSTIYSATKDEITNKINEFQKSNPRISVDSDVIFDFLVECGLFKLKDARHYTFRLNGFFEYFLAYQMTTDLDFLEEILSDEKLYLAFKNQIEIYAGFRSDDENFLSIINEKTASKVTPVFSIYDGSIDELLKDKIREPQKIEEFCRNSEVRSLTSSEKADIQDSIDELQTNSSVHIIQDFDISVVNPEIIERYISILARVFKNADNISNFEFTTQVFRKIVDYYCYWSFYLVDECVSFVKKDFYNDQSKGIKDSRELELLKMVSNVIPLVAQLDLYDGIGHYNLTKMVKHEVEELSKDEKANQYKLFVLYFLLLDIDLEENFGCIDLILEKISLPILKYLTKLKLNYYLAFKTDKKDSLKRNLSSRIQTVNRLIDNSITPDSLQKGIAQQKNISLINKNKL